MVGIPFINGRVYARWVMAHDDRLSGVLRRRSVGRRNCRQGRLAAPPATPGTLRQTLICMVLLSSRRG